jgi:hypothetical protein
MRITSAAAAVTCAIVLVLALGGIPTSATAGPACNELGLANNCIRSNDLQARLALRQAGLHGRLQIRDADNANALDLNGASATVTNLFSNLENESNGLVKAWAVINPNGAVIACWRCNLSAAQTQRLGTGNYEVDFTPLATDIRGRPRLTAPDGSDSFGSFVVIRSADRFGDESSVQVLTNQANTGAFVDSAFTLVIY